MDRNTVYIPPYDNDRRHDGREWVVFESLVAFLALLLIISGFALYIDNAFASNEKTSSVGAIEISTRNGPLSLVEA